MTYMKRKLPILSALAVVSAAIASPSLAQAHDVNCQKTIVNVKDNKVSMDYWEQLAEVSSGGDWAFVSEDGLRGGLAISEDNWKNYGGEDFAPTADKATKEEQIEIAEKIFADSGFDSWEGAKILRWTTNSNRDIIEHPYPGVSMSAQSAPSQK